MLKWFSHLLAGKIAFLAYLSLKKSWISWYFYTHLNWAWKKFYNLEARTWYRHKCTDKKEPNEYYTGRLHCTITTHNANMGILLLGITESPLPNNKLKSPNTHSEVTITGRIRRILLKTGDAPDSSNFLSVHIPRTPPPPPPSPHTHISPPPQHTHPFSPQSMKLIPLGQPNKVTIAKSSTLKQSKSCHSWTQHIVMNCSTFL